MAGRSGRTDPKTETSKEAAPFPYEKYQGSDLWKTIERAIADLVRNGDLEEKTSRKYIVGYLCKKLSSRLEAG